jgi:hypothetical protein
MEKEKKDAFLPVNCFGSRRHFGEGGETEEKRGCPESLSPVLGGGRGSAQW